MSGRVNSELNKAECSYDDQRGPNLLDVLCIPVLGPAPQHHQTENILIDVSKRWQKQGEYSWHHLPAICDHPVSLWSVDDQTATGAFNCISEADATQASNSLYLIHVTDLTLSLGVSRNHGGRTYHAAFTYNQIKYKFSMTDPVAMSAFLGHHNGSYPIGKAYLCISLSHLFDKDRRCHKLVAGIITEPRL